VGGGGHINFSYWVATLSRRTVNSEWCRARTGGTDRNRTGRRSQLKGGGSSGEVKEEKRPRVSSAYLETSSEEERRTQAQDSGKPRKAIQGGHFSAEKGEHRSKKKQRRKRDNHSGEMKGTAWLGPAEGKRARRPRFADSAKKLGPKEVLPTFPSEIRPTHSLGEALSGKQSVKKCGGEEGNSGRFSSYF